MPELTNEGRILKTDQAQRYTLGVVYEPDVKDSQDEWASAEEIRKASWDFARSIQGKKKVKKMANQLLQLILKGLENKDAAGIDVTDIYDELKKAESEGGSLGLMHKEFSNEFGDIVENYTAPVDMVIEGETIKKGSWLLGVVWTEEIFEQIQKGELGGYSMGGVGRRRPDPEGEEVNN